MHKTLVVGLVLIMGAVVIAQEKAAQDAKKVPDEFAIKILRAQRDEATRQIQYEQLTKQYQEQQKQISDAFQADAKEIDLIKTAALKAMGKDSAKYDIDMDKLEVVDKPPAPATPAASIPAKPAKK